MKYKKMVTLLTLLIWIICLYDSSLICKAIEYNNVEIKPILSDLPIIKNSKYFDLKVEPNVHYKIRLSVKNNTNKSVSIKSIVKNAETNDNGNIVYNNLSKKNNLITSKLIGKNLRHYKLNPNQIKIISYDFYTGKKMIRGSELGAVITTFSSSTNQNGIINKISYINGISLTGKYIKPNVKNIAIKSWNYTNQNQSYYIVLKNTTPTIFKNLNIEIRSNKFSKHFNNVSISPNSQFKLKIPSNYRDIELNKTAVKINGFNVNNKYVDHEQKKFSFRIIIFSIVVALLITLTIRRKIK
ncbi:WxL protein peptidoglycan domain-containing protein [Apilactobacillus xinyiensis]|uniref:WxL protein peptidoglycan domain-containing protein n=1 Tax=Apilactobacillus xinyiensis TaxID=2841032 RepID=UPI00200C9457|nr:DUF916 domain-containing protein [Apilactobacillus xinyiensis]MCL0318932.1 DUF916 and DUF3324 domain-containing protein [Apilactobacillus xinyiensis]